MSFICGNCPEKLQPTFCGLAKCGAYSTTLQSKHQSSNLAQSFIRSTSPRISPNRCWLLPFLSSVKFFAVVCRVGCGLAVLKIFEGKGILKNNFVRAGKGLALLQVLVGALAFAGLANVPDPVRSLSFFLRIQTFLSQWENHSMRTVTFSVRIVTF